MRSRVSLVSVLEYVKPAIEMVHVYLHFPIRESKNI